VGAEGLQLSDLLLGGDVPGSSEPGAGEPAERPGGPVQLLGVAVAKTRTAGPWKYSDTSAPSSAAARANPSGDSSSCSPGSEITAASRQPGRRAGGFLITFVLVSPVRSALTSS